MRTEEQIRADAEPDHRAFSNGTEYEIWAGRYCYECVHDDAETEKWCPILTVALLGAWPKEWTRATEPYTHVDTCTEFEQRPDDDGPDDDEPEPDGPGPFDPEMPGEVDIFEVMVEQALERGVPTYDEIAREKRLADV